MPEYIKSNEKKYNGVFLFIGLIVFLFFLKMEIYYLNLEESIQEVMNYLSIAVIVIGFGLFLFALISNRTFSALVMKSFLFVVVGAFSTFLVTKSGDILSQFVYNQAFFFAVITLLYYFLKKPYNIQSISNLMFVTLILFSLIYIKYKIDARAFSPGAVNSIYYISLLLPFVLINKNMLVKILGIIDITVLTLISNKRTAFLMIALALFAYFFMILSSNATSFGKKLAIFLAFIAGILVLMNLYDYFAQLLGINIVDRLDGMMDDGGSGRLDIYKTVLAGIKEFDFSEFLIGKGYNGVFRVSAVGNSAHDDFLEIFYDYGLIGFSLYISIIVEVFKKCVRLFKVKSQFAIPYLVSLIPFIFMSLFSHLMIYPTYFMYLIIFWSVIKVEKNPSY